MNQSVTPPPAQCPFAIGACVQLNSGRLAIVVDMVKVSIGFEPPLWSVKIRPMPREHQQWNHPFDWVIHTELRPMPPPDGTPARD
jgi:hypothetical protein